MRYFKIGNLRRLSLLPETSVQDIHQIQSHRSGLMKILQRSLDIPLSLDFHGKLHKQRWKRNSFHSNITKRMIKSKIKSKIKKT